MCLGAIYWARPKMVYYGCTRKDAGNIGFDDQFIYDEINEPIENRQIKFIPLMRDEALTAFSDWQTKNDKTEY
jgi:guanine deaminase